MVSPTNLKVTMDIEASTDTVYHNLQKDTVVLDNNDNDQYIPDFYHPVTKIQIIYKRRPLF